MDIDGMCEGTTFVGVRTGGTHTVTLGSYGGDGAGLGRCWGNVQTGGAAQRIQRVERLWI